MSFKFLNINNSANGGNMNTTSPIASDKKIALCCGLNDYPGSGNDLNGCVNDAIEWSNLLSSTYGFKTTLLKNNEVTSSNVINALKDMIAKAGEDWHVVWTYSGHGSNVPDQNGDEPDSRDECLCFYDRFFIDDEIKTILKTIHPKARFTFISDSCHSGTVTRAFLSTLSIESDYAKPRFLPPSENPNNAVAPRSLGKIMSPEESMNEILISGCLPTEYSYDANMNGKYMGAMSYHAINILKKTPHITYSALYAELRKQLPNSHYPQTPQLEGKQENKDRIVFS